MVGVRRAIDDDRAQDLRLGFGLAELLTEELHDTGWFRLVDPRRTPAADRAEALARTLWEGSSPPAPAALDRLAADLGVTHVAWAELIRFASPRTRSFVGPFSSRTNRIEIGVRACVRDRERGRTACAEGAGAAEASGTGVLFEYRPKGVVFDRTTIGSATADALHQAVVRLTGGTT